MLKRIVNVCVRVRVCVCVCARVCVCLYQHVDLFILFWLNLKRRTTTT